MTLAAFFALAATGTALAAAIACLVQAWRRRGRNRASWVALALALISGALAGPAGPDGPPGAGHLGMVVLAAAAVCLMPGPASSRISRVRALFDAVLVASTLLTIGWGPVIAPVLAAGGTLTYPIADVLLATAGLTVLGYWNRHLRSRRTILLFGLGLLVVAIADSVAQRMMAEGHHPSGTAAGSLAGFALILGGTIFALREPLPPGGRRRVVESETRTLAILLPYALVLLTFVMGVVWLAATGAPSGFGIWSRFVLIFMVAIRQVLLLLENRRLARRLEDRVAERTAELQAREQRFRALVEQSSDCLAIVEADSTIRYQSESVKRIFGYAASDVVGRKAVDVAGSGERIQAGIDEVLDRPGATTVFEITLAHADGRPRLAEMTITNLMDDPHVRGLVFNTRDVSDARDLQEQLRHEAYHDSLTGLANRSLFRERLAGAVERRECGEKVAILFLDLDGFKEVNDSLGHIAGDHLLVQVAGRLRDGVGEPHMVARLGGDEFAVIVEADDARSEAERIAAHILAMLDQPFPVDGRDVQVGAGIGVATAADAGDIEQLQRNADLAMYRAKDAGGGVYATYDPRMHDDLVHRLELAADLRLALQRDELVLHYQPTVDLRTGEIVGFEALVRWMHPARGMVPPLDFIGVAESTGLIVPLGRWVLAEACRQAVAWDRPLKMAVNVSVRQFDDEDLAATVAEVLSETGMPADRLCLEMTESVLLTDTDENLARIVRLKALGVMLAMDDFGTGYSSLAYLRRFPMDVLKIDRSFVDRLGGASEDEVLVNTIVRLGQRFGMQTVAEGIEDARQLDILREMGCDFAQGYFLSRPLPAAEAGRLLESGLPVPVS
ncbi:bifunctional diguanylate cyclase/phosphodiesterase [Actinoplanes sp. TBRC 11911]|uniref:putative bifunctional diguanylate cyclase/phosphodiesterase n=1 Tax=Actinoplanes sp. TBRC 11911 TaxID=2729386 RepID=UPI0020070A16|nr:EAL domain-containing protein [Actinoplanes sp. TBRC 11911]